MEETKHAKKAYDQMVKKASPNSPIVSNCLRAFISGGLICVLGQVIHDFIARYVVTEDETALLTSVTLILLSVVLTGFGIYEKLGKFCGAGTIIPITGFANSVASPAIEFKKEGYIFGTGAKMFILAGPVIVYGTITSMVVGIVYLFFR